LSQPEGDINEDGRLDALEVMKLDLKADLVVLSACETARGKVGNGEGMIGLSWAFFVAGAPATVASQWSVDAASTTELMFEFRDNHHIQLPRLYSSDNLCTNRSSSTRKAGRHLTPKYALWL